MEAVTVLMSLLVGWLCSGILPLLLCVLACIDNSRRGGPWWWYPVVIGVPVIGPVVYLVATRGPWAAVDSRGTDRQRRRLAESRLRDLQVQLAHWRGPSVLAEAGEELLALSRFAEAEAHFREARERGAMPEETHLGLAEALVAQGRLAPALAPLQELLAKDPDHAIGRAQLLLARCLDELDRGPEAEAALRKVLERRNPAEARVRLARRLVLRGHDAEGRAIANEVVAESALLAPAMRRTQARWTRLARAVAAGKTELPKVASLEAAGRRARWPWIAGLVALGLIVVAGVATAVVVAWRLASAVAVAHDTQDDARAAVVRLAAFRRASPWTQGDDPASVVLEERDVTAYMAVRVAMKNVRRQATSSLEAGGHPGTEHALALISACEAARLDPAAIPLLVEVIDWRFLHREQAAVAVLPDSVQQEVFSTMRWLAEGDPDAGDEAAWRREQEAKIGELLSLAPKDDALAPATRALLETRRAELEALDASCIRDLCLAAAEVSWLEELARVRAESAGD